LVAWLHSGPPAGVTGDAGVQEKRSAYAPGEDQPVRYDGIYRIARAYRKPGVQGKLVCRYLFMRCDNEPAPWSSEGAEGGQPARSAVHAWLHVQSPTHACSRSRETCMMEACMMEPAKGLTRVLSDTQSCTHGHVRLLSM